jgi:hypothetical protein
VFQTHADAGLVQCDGGQIVKGEQIAFSSFLDCGLDLEFTQCDLELSG